MFAGPIAVLSSNSFCHACNMPIHFRARCSKFLGLAH
uniref:Uncharacterized protein n=1 Tax=Arundo donax TaxID=35708 RepID=A0A0A9FT87_ARUDO